MRRLNPTAFDQRVVCWCCCPFNVVTVMYKMPVINMHLS